MTFTTPEFRKPKSGRRIPVLLVCVALLLVGVVATVLVSRSGGTGPQDTAPHTESATIPPQSQDSGYTDLRWSPVGRVELPFSEQYGPHTVDGSQASGYDHSELGAVLAAWQIPLRLVTVSSPEAILTNQVAGDNDSMNSLRSAIAYFQAGDPDSAPLLAARPTAFKIVDYQPRFAVVDFAVRQPNAAYAIARYTVVWVGGDDGDWKYQPFVAAAPVSPVTSLAGFTSF
jgi:hypothetical protein